MDDTQSAAAAPPVPTRFAPVVIAPTYNNSATVISVLERVEALGLPIIVVNDGCTDETGRLLAEWAGAGRAGDDQAGGRRVRVEVVTHARNRGKAEALFTGFDAAAKAGFTHAATIDTDGQLDPESLPELLKVAEARPRALVLGVRSEVIEGCPSRSLVGRRLSNLAIRCEAGVAIIDSQCGLRVYPLELIAATTCKAGRFAFEAEILTRAAWAGFEIEQVPVACRYRLESGERVSHFKPGRDSLSGLALHARLLGEAMLFPWRTRPPRRGRADRARRHSGRGGRAGRRRGKGVRAGRRSRRIGAPVTGGAMPTTQNNVAAAESGTPAGAGARSAAKRPRSVWELVKRFGAWVSPLEMWRQLRSDRIGRTQISIGLALGVFIANLPLYGLQTILALYTARRLHLHPLSVLLGSQISTPPLSPVLIAAGIAVGHFIRYGVWITPDDFDTSLAGLWPVVGQTVLDWTVGGLVLGALLGAATFGVSQWALRFIPMKEEGEQLTVDS